MRTIRIGAGAGFSGDRIEPAVELAERGDVQYLVFECLAERTIALAQQARLRDPGAGYDPLLAARMRAVLRPCRERGIRIVTNMGAANPVAAAAAVAAVARELGLDGLRIAAVTGDDVLDAVRGGDHRLDETGEPVSALGDRLVSANAYLGAGPIAAALAQGADVVVTGRAADPAMFLAPLVHEFGWSMSDWTRLGRGTVVGHLLECAGQITGGYFVDPGVKDVPDLARLGFPLAEVAEDGTAVVTKAPGSGGRVTTATCKEQLLYEVHDPARYLQPDVVADFSGVRVSEAGFDRVRVEGGDGAPRTGLLKVSVGYRDSWVGEGQISYAGAGAVARGRLALDIVAERLRMTGVATRETRFELIGVDAILGPALSAGAPEPREVRVRVVGRTDDRAQAERIGQEVESLYLNGPAGGGGATKSAREIVGIRSLLLPEAAVTPALHVVES
ncbi:acyclic terpene utilization AtuA family protein [uncultured Methylobacterium sp.]|uniref:acyclic terpene utilization AtuA family protein n=1 Tax=uncultured Methylobacterium sp. TaxID=157278 RepID=UPI0026023228|nr:acyclic terpene utilization AtuA family protein [uncultured Methylobacterium sp.]